ncbi:FGGY family carbohydrate kinase [Microbacterium sp. NPDC055910]|uniref:FGGY family carbohydrate kinase n=1 Tax=Microbacterium sp. NPDC055910 TaxID=3345659 RepID=UPI0035E2329D
MTGRYVVALDEGSSSARAIVIDDAGRTVGEASAPVATIFPREGWVEFDPQEMWDAPRRSLVLALERAGITAADVAAVGVTSHRETIVMWDRSTGVPVYNAVTWMSKQTDDIVREWSERGLDDEFRSRTGVRNDSFYSAPKIAWLLRHVPGVRERAERGELAIGTPDTWMLWNLTGGTAHRTEPSAASRTGLMSLARAQWDEEFCAMLDIPTSLLPEIVPSAGWFGDVAHDVLPAPHPVPVTAVLGDQQAGLFGQACLEAGSAKNTFGTAGVLTVNMGDVPRTLPGMCSSVAWQFGDKVTYEAEGVVFHSGQTIQWLRDRLGILSDAGDSEAVASSVPDTGGVYLVPGFAGLFDPHWDRNARGAIVGLTLESSAAHVVRAGIEAMAYQTRDNVDNLRRHGVEIPMLKVDGGATRNDLLCQFQADILGIPVSRPVGLERTALGIAHLAGSEVGMWARDDIHDRWQLERIFEPLMPAEQREELYRGWSDAVAAVRGLPPRVRA